jgi:hypothetical protein
MNGAPAKSTAETRHRAVLVIWGAQLLSLVLLFALTRLIAPEEPPEPNPTLLLALGVAGLTAFGASFALKAKLIAQASAQRRLELAQTAYVAAFALAESCALLGVVAHFVTGARESVYFFAPAALGLLLHFPRRRDFRDPPGEGAGFTTTM